MFERLPQALRPSRKKHEIEEYPVKLERMEGELVRRNDAFPEIASLSDEQMLDFAHFAVDPEHPGGVWVDHRPGHNRSFVWSDSTIADGDGIDHGKLNIKGTGFVSLGGVGGFLDSLKGHHLLPELHRRTLRPNKPREYKFSAYHQGMWGLMSLEDAEADYDNGERLSALGIRTSRGVAIIRLKTIYYPGKGISKVEDLKKSGIIPEGYEPVVYVRATGADNRIQDYEDPKLFPRSNRSWLKERKASAIGSAMERVKTELGKESFSTEEYLRWFAETLGTQVGTLHANGYTHGGLYKNSSEYVHPVDITLDCRLLDLDNIQDLKEVEARFKSAGMDPSGANGVLALGMQEDVESAKKSLKILLGSCRDISKILDTGEVQPATKQDTLLASMLADFDTAYEAAKSKASS